MDVQVGSRTSSAFSDLNKPGSDIDNVVISIIIFFIAVEVNKGIYRYSVLEKSPIMGKVSEINERVREMGFTSLAYLPTDISSRAIMLESSNGCAPSSGSGERGQIDTRLT